MLIVVKQVLNEKDDADVAMVRSLREQVGDVVVGFVHKIVDQQQRWLPAVKVVHVQQVLMERHPRILAKQLLIFFLATDDTTRRRIYHDARIFGQLEDETRLAASGRSRYECRERVAQRQSHVSTVGVVTAERRRRKPRKEAIKALNELTNNVSTTYTISRCCCCCRSSTRQSTWYVPFDILVRLTSHSSVNVLFIALPSPSLSHGGREKGKGLPRALSMCLHVRASRTRAIKCVSCNACRMTTSVY